MLFSVTYVCLTDELFNAQKNYNQLFNSLGSPRFSFEIHCSGKDLGLRTSQSPKGRQAFSRRRK